ECNMKIADGVAPIVKLLKAGVVVALGTDSCAVNDNMDMFEAMRAAAFLQKVTAMDPTVLSAEQTLRMATLGGAEALGMEKEIGSLQAGKRADLLVVDLTGSHLRPINKIENALVYCASAHDIETVICDGKVVMEHRQIRAFDEEEWVSNAVDYAYARFREDGIALPNYFRLENV
ncbi:MAG: amidohydrolase family protein, partial [Chloroflexi bacterium]|nr:amidohydrolase family protein [Chloroflexota bacterium]